MVGKTGGGSQNCAVKRVWPTLCVGGGFDFSLILQPAPAPPSPFLAASGPQGVGYSGQDPALLLNERFDISLLFPTAYDYNNAQLSKWGVCVGGCM